MAEAHAGKGRPRVLIIGCGFGGLEAARALRGAPVDITLKPGAAVLPDAVALPSGSLSLPAGVQVSALPGYAEGA